MTDTKEAASIMGRIGGATASKTMTAEEKSARGRKAALAKNRKGIPQASHAGDLHLGSITIPCAVVNGRRLISQSGLQQAFGQSKGGRKGKVAVAIKSIETEWGRAIPAPIRFGSFAPLITKDLLTKCEIVKFIHPKNNSVSYGYDAEALPYICELYLQARSGGGLALNQLPFARSAEIILGALARVGVQALVDEASGYQEVRERDELTKILNKFIAAELQPWTKRFHPDFFQQIYRLYGWKWGDFKRNHPSCVGKFINKYVYNRLAPGVLEELRRVNPLNDGGNRVARHHQHLTEDVGHASLDKQLLMVTAFMRASRDKHEFDTLITRAMK